MIGISKLVLMRIGTQCLMTTNTPKSGRPSHTPADPTTPTILELLYYFTYLCAPPLIQNWIQRGIRKEAPNTRDTAPQIPDLNYV
jgi:hypothetical protein